MSSKVNVSVNYIVPSYMRVYSWEQSLNISHWRNFISSNYYISLYVTLAYLAFIFLGQKYMSSRAPFKLNKMYTLWNFALASFCLTGFSRTLPELLHVLQNGPDGFYRSLCLCFKEAYPDDLALVKLINHLMLDLIYVKSSWHHISILNFCWLVYDNYEPRFRWFQAMNYGCHGVMYGYFAITSVKIKVPPLLNKAIMGLQLSQMVMGVFLVLCSLWIKGNGYMCIGQKRYLYLTMLMYLSFFFLFAKYYTKVSLKKLKTV